MACPRGSEHHVRPDSSVYSESGKSEEIRNFTGGPNQYSAVDAHLQASKMPWDSLKMIVSCICRVGCQVLKRLLPKSAEGFYSAIY